MNCSAACCVEIHRDDYRLSIPDSSSGHATDTSIAGHHWLMPSGVLSFDFFSVYVLLVQAILHTDRIPGKLPIVCIAHCCGGGRFALCKWQPLRGNSAL